MQELSKTVCLKTDGFLCPQQTFISSKLTIETLEKGVKYVQS